MAERNIIFDVGPVNPCGCRWQLWAEDGAWHIGAACAKCQNEIVEVVHEIMPGLPVTEGD